MSPGGAPELWPQAERDVAERPVDGEDLREDRVPRAPGRTCGCRSRPERLSPSRKYCSLGTVCLGNGFVVMSSSLMSLTKTVPAASHDHVARPCRDAKHEHAVVGVLVGDDVPRSVTAACTATMSSWRGSPNAVRDALGEHAPVAARESCSPSRPSRQARRARGSPRSRARRARRRRRRRSRAARTIQRSTAATLPEAAVAAPACFFLHAGRGLRSRLSGGDA